MGLYGVGCEGVDQIGGGREAKGFWMGAVKRT